ncbi:unnamed protein product [Symbiodinium sp. CCMP2592]|nr:unnamed protein product [Symbiodinium sp. CCMP2592]
MSLLTTKEIDFRGTSDARFLATAEADLIVSHLSHQDTAPQRRLPSSSFTEKYPGRGIEIPHLFEDVQNPSMVEGAREWNRPLLNLFSQGSVSSEIAKGFLNETVRPVEDWRACILDCFRHPPQLLHFARGTRAFRGNVVKPRIHLLVRLVLKAGIGILRGREGLEVKDFELIAPQVLKGVLEDLFAYLGISRPPSVDVSLAVYGGQEEAGFALAGEDEMLDDVVFLIRSGNDEDLQFGILWDRLSWTKRRQVRSAEVYTEGSLATLAAEEQDYNPFDMVTTTTTSITTTRAQPPAISLKTAAKRGDVEALVQHLKAGSDLNAPDP